SSQEPFASNQPGLSDNADESDTHSAVRRVAAHCREWRAIVASRRRVPAQSSSTPACRDAADAEAIPSPARARALRRHTAPPRGLRSRITSASNALLQRRNGSNPPLSRPSGTLCPSDGERLGEKFPRKISRIEPLKRSSRREEALIDFGFRISDFGFGVISLLTLAAARFMGSLLSLLRTHWEHEPPPHPTSGHPLPHWGRGKG